MSFAVLLMAIISSAFFIGLGLWAIFGSSRNIIMGYLSNRWPSTYGTIVKSSAKHVGKGFHIAEIEYTYTISGHAYAGQGLGFGQHSTKWNTSSLDKASELAAKYPINSKQKVFYDPRRHEKSVLRVGVHWSQFIILMLGVAWASMGIFLVIKALLR